MKSILSFTVTMLLLIIPTFAQEVEMADAFRSEGKIYVVVLVMSIVTVGLFGYLFYLDKKISAREKSTEKK